jgi:hypothetical protein
LKFEPSSAALKFEPYIDYFEKGLEDGTDFGIWMKSKLESNFF